jgi:hypothetical protein
MALDAVCFHSMLILNCGRKGVNFRSEFVNQFELPREAALSSFSDELAYFVEWKYRR